LERSFHDEIQALKLGAGQTFHGEGILAVTKALLQSGVTYVGGYQGSPISHLLDVMVQSRDYLDELGVHVEACTNEARPPPCWPRPSCTRCAARSPGNRWSAPMSRPTP
jgi:indolepyruvate ferredoxin oxidoreductase alpha subunit